MSGPSSKKNELRPLIATFDMYKMLDGWFEKRLQRISDGYIVKRFDKTPYPEKESDVVCPHFMQLKWGWGCPYDCAWCFLKGTLRFQPEKTAPKTKSREKIRRHVESALAQTMHPEVFNTGELCDSLMDERRDVPFSHFIIEPFQRQNTHKVLFLTKSAYVDELLKIKDHSQAIVSFSLNADSIAKKWEKAPAPQARIKAATRLSEAGWEVRVRIDPIVPVQDWREVYRSLVENMFSQVTPERITLGTPRGLQSTLNNITDRSWVLYLDAKQSGWGRKVADEQREVIYRCMPNMLEGHISLDRVGLCKETLGMFETLGRVFREQVCNCVP
jgi:spore photoproduct lyase